MKGDKMHIFGDKKYFGFGLKFLDNDAGELRLFIQNEDILQYKWKGKLYHYVCWDLKEIVEWWENNLDIIPTEKEFPIEITGMTGVEKYTNSLEGDLDMFEELFEKIQDWGFQHSWFSARVSSCLADVYFRKVENDIEISWDNYDLFPSVTFIHEKGVYYVSLEDFKECILQFIECYRNR